MRTFLPAMWPAFFILVSPASRKAKPACMNITSTAVTTTQIVLAAISRSWFLGTDLHLLDALAGPVVGDVRDQAGPAETVACLVAAARGVDHGLHSLADHHRLDLDHPSLLSFAHKKSAPGAETPEAPMPPCRALDGATPRQTSGRAGRFQE